MQRDKPRPPSQVLRRGPGRPGDCSDLPALVSGARFAARAVVLVVDAAGMAAWGHRSGRSVDGVWLADHVPLAFLRSGDL
jgi:RNA:NAD 2'-phosphotransferase (TPT1/KptA family)